MRTALMPSRTPLSIAAALLLIVSPFAGRASAQRASTAEPGSAAARAEAWAELCRRYDQNGNGAISRREYGRGNQVFTFLDQDADQTLTPADFKLRERGPDGAPRVGEFAPHFLLQRADGPGVLSSSTLGADRPLALVFASYTHPTFRKRAARLAELEQAYGDRMGFVLVYLREAHALDSPEPGTFPAPGVEDPWTLDGRRALCMRALEDLELDFPAGVDDVDDPTGKAFDAWPARLFLIDGFGQVRFASERGPQGLALDDLELAILSLLTGSDEAAQAAGRDPLERPAAQSRTRTQPERTAGGAPGQAPLLLALDADGSGTLSRAEIEAAPALLLGFDANGDGELVPEEVRAGLTALVQRERAAEAELSGPAVIRRKRSIPPPPPALPDDPKESDPATQESASEPAAEPPAGAPAARAAEPPPVDGPRRGPSRGESPLAGRSLASFDYDRDQRLSRIEVPRGMLERWDEFDSNRDGYLNADEQAAVEARLGAGAGR